MLVPAGTPSACALFAQNPSASVAAASTEMRNDFKKTPLNSSDFPRSLPRPIAAASVKRMTSCVLRPSLQCIIGMEGQAPRDRGHAHPVATGKQITYNECSPSGGGPCQQKDPGKPVKM